MRNARIREEQAANYHVMSRVVDRRWVFNDDEKERCAIHGRLPVGRPLRVFRTDFLSLLSSSTLLQTAFVPNNESTA
jgi:hypothetical protein